MWFFVDYLVFVDKNLFFEDINQDKVEDENQDKVKDENIINQWIDNVSDDIIVTDSIDKWVDNLEQINIDEILITDENQNKEDDEEELINLSLVKNDINNETESEGESSESSDEEDEIQMLQKQFKSQYEQEKHINPIIRHTYNKLIHSSSDEELVDIIDTILPEEQKEIDELFIKSILNDLEMFRKNNKNNTNRIAIYNQIAKLMNKPLYI